MALPLYSNVVGFAGQIGAPNCEIWPCVLREVKIMNKNGARKITRRARVRPVTKVMLALLPRICVIRLFLAAVLVLSPRVCVNVLLLIVYAPYRLSPA